MRSGTLTFAVGKPSSRPRASPCSTGPAHFVRATEDRGRAFDVARREQRADARRRVRRGRAGIVAARRARGRSSRSRARRPCAAAAARRRGGGSRSGSRRRPRRAARGATLASSSSTNCSAGSLLRVSSNGSTRHLVDAPRRLEQLELLVERREDARRRLGPHDFGGMAVEREHGGRQAARVREVVHEPQHRLVAEVHAVERADRDRAFAVARTLRSGSR